MVPSEADLVFTWLTKEDAMHVPHPTVRVLRVALDDLSLSGRSVPDDIASRVAEGDLDEIRGALNRHKFGYLGMLREAVQSADKGDFDSAADLLCVFRGWYVSRSSFGALDEVDRVCRSAGVPSPVGLVAIRKAGQARRDAKDFRYWQFLEYWGVTPSHSTHP